MPFGPIPVLGAGAGAGAATEGLQQTNVRQQDILAQLLMQAQALQAQREYTQAYRQQIADARNTSAQAAKERADTAAQNLTRESLNAIPGGAQVPENLATSPIAAGQTESRLPSRQYAGFSQIQPSTPTAGGQTGSASSGEMQAQTRPGGFFKLPSAQEQQAQQTLDLRKLEAATKQSDEPLVEVEEGGKPVFRRRSEAIGKPAFQKPVQTPTVEIKTVDAQGNPITKIVPKEVGKEYAAAPPAQTVVKREDRKRALDGLDQLDSAIENAKAFIGPGMGRVSSMEQMIGNPDPKIQALGTKMLMSKMTVDAGIGGARAAASPQLLQRWDGLFSQKLTPEALHATVQAMREMMGGQSVSGASQGSAPAAARRFNPATGRVE